MGVLVAVIGIAMWVTIIAACLFGKRPRDCCPSCWHADGTDGHGECANADSYCGWGSDKCTCTNDYHAERQRQSSSAYTSNASNGD